MIVFELLLDKVFLNSFLKLKSLNGMPYMVFNFEKYLFVLSVPSII